MSALWLLALLMGSDAHAQWVEGRARALVRMPVEFASDAWAVVTAPVRLDRAGALQLGAVVGASALLFVFDEQITDAIVRNRDVTPLDGVENVGEVVEPFGLMGNTNKYFVGAWLAGTLIGSDRISTIAKELFFSHWLAGASRKIVGYGVGRMRPEERFGAYEFRPGDGSSFPSGHASTIMQVATVLSHHIDRPVATIALHSAAAALLYQRVSSEKHWASETFLGAAWGLAIARIVIDRRENNRSDFVSITATNDGLMVRIPIGN